jgi:CheY-like chemotaxis protein
VSWKEVTDLFVAITTPQILVLVIVFVFRTQIIDAWTKFMNRDSGKFEAWGFRFEWAAKQVTQDVQESIRDAAGSPNASKDDILEVVDAQLRKLPELLAAQSRVVPVAAELPQTDAVSKRPTVTAPSARRAQILWVDDRPAGNTTEARLLSQMGAKVVFKTSTQDALAELARDTYDLVITDMARWEGDVRVAEAGCELLKEVRSRHSNLPVVFYVGKVGLISPDCRREAAAATDDPRELIDVVARLAGAAP